MESSPNAVSRPRNGYDAEVDLETLLRVYILESDNPDMKAYWGLDAFNVPRMRQETLRVLRMGRMTGGRVLDIGCGFGWGALLLAAVGRNTVVANDVRGTMTRVVDERTADLRARGFDFPISTLLGDVCTLDLPADSFDAVHSHQAIEHIHDLPKLFAVVRRILKPGGRGVFLNDSNALHPPTRRHALAMWPRRDRDPEYIAELKRERPIENADIEPYAVMRRRIIARVRPDLDEAETEALCAAAAGLTEADIADVAGGYTPGAPLPTPPALSWCRNPVTMEYCERLLDPFEVADLARREGLEARVWHHGFNRVPLTALNVLNGLPLPWLNRMVFRLRPSFAVVVARPAAS